MRKEPHIPPEKSRKALDFDLMASKRFYRTLGESLPMKGSPKWSPKDCDVLRRLRTIDGYSRRDILSVLDFIATDVREGFCFARNCRSIKNLRLKWKNGFTKFSTAYNAMIESRGMPENAGNRDSQKVDGDSPREKDCPVCKAALGLIRANWNGSSEKDDGCLSLARSIDGLLRAFVEKRNWPLSLPSAFASRVSGLRVRFLSANLLAKVLLEFLSSPPDGIAPGVYAREIRGRIVTGPDDSYMAAAMEVVGAYLGEAERRHG